MSNRFSKIQIEYLAVLLRVPDPLITERRNPIPANLALSILLGRLTSPGRLIDLETVFGLRYQTLSAIVIQLSNYIFRTWAEPILTGFNNKLLTPTRLEEYAQAVLTRGCPIRNIWGFVDVTFHLICRPKRHQRVNYNGYKGQHANKHNAIATPDGLLVHCSLPIEGRRADSTVLALSGLEEKLNKHAYGLSGQRMFIYGDPAYGTTDTIISAAKERIDLPLDEQNFYTAMSRGRICVEWGFGKLFQLFKFLKYTPSMRLLLSPVGCHFLNAVFFTNIHTCLNGSITSKTFGLSPPSVEEYLATIV